MAHESPGTNQTRTERQENGSFNKPEEEYPFFKTNGVVRIEFLKAPGARRPLLATPSTSCECLKNLCVFAMTRPNFVIATSDSLLSQTNQSWVDWTVIIPSVSIGNAPQLAIDLLVSTLLSQKQASLAGYINTYTLQPVIGPNPYDLHNSSPAMPGEIYISSKLKLVILQIRSPPFHDRKYSFVNQLVDWLKQCSFKQCVVLTSSFSQFLFNPDEEYSAGFPVKFSTSSNFETSAENLLSIGLKPVVKVDRFSMAPDPNGRTILPGCGFAKNLFEKLVKNSIKSILLVKYCSEGDNSHDASTLLSSLIKCLQLQKVDLPVKYVTPVSWNHLFGSDIAHELF